MDLSKKPENYFDKYAGAIKNVLCNINGNALEITDWMVKVVEELSGLKKKSGKIHLIGNGASCSMAAHFAVDFTKNGGIRSFSHGEGALITCFSNDFSFETAYGEILKRYMDKGDMLFAISSSGKSKNILNAAEQAKKTGNKIITFTGFSKENPLRKTGDYNLYIGSDEYGPVESAHAYYMHMLLDILVQK